MNQKPDPDLWVVIPTYNRAEDVLACLDSLIKAHINEKQIIIVDNHSKDDTEKKVRQKFPKAKLIVLEENIGATGASNVGFQFALSQKAKYILRLDSDTIVAQDFLQYLLKIAANDDLVGVVAPKIYYYDPPDEIWYAGADAHPWHFGTINGHRHEKDAPQNSQIREVDYAWGAAMLIKREVLQQSGGFDTDFFIYYEEVDFCLRVKKLGYKILFVPKSNVWHKVGSSANNAWTAYHWNRSKMLFYRKFARGTAHFLSLVVYAFAYAILDAVQNFLKIREKSGNRGPLKDALQGLWNGLHEQRFNRRSVL